MKIAEFDYTDGKGKQSHRVILINNEPSETYAGVDVTSLSNEDIGMMVTEYNALITEFQYKVEALKTEFDVLHNYRQFLPSRMTNLTVEHA